MRKFIATVIVIVSALVGAITVPAGAQVSDPSRQDYTGPQEVSTAGPVVVLNWKMPDRYSLVPKTFAEVNPTSWRIDVDTCGSYSREGTVKSIRWKLKDSAGRLLLDTTTCKRSATVASLGKYTIDVTVVATNGTRTRSYPIELKDHLIVVAGDSMASGEGNPDVKGNAKLEVCGQTIDPSNAQLEMSYDPGCVNDLIDIMHGDIPSIIDGRPSTWKLDPDCHRSYKSGLSLAARDIETRDPHTSVTFINVACSGAEVKHLFSDTYDGLYTEGPWDTGVKQPQADQIARLVCGLRTGSCNARARAIDGIFVSIGINDLKLSDVLKDCMKPDFKQILGVDGCHDSSFDTIEEGLSGLRPAYGMGERLHALGVPVKSVYQAVYPVHVFAGAPTSCGAFLFINGMEKAWLQESNLDLNQSIYQAYTPHYYWRPTWRDETANPWKGHGYCAGSNRYFVSLFDSLTQYNGVRDKITYGTVHPNAKGHEVFRQEFLNENIQRTRPVTDHLVVAVEGVQVKGVEESLNGWFTATIARQGSDGIPRWGTERWLKMPDEIDFRPGQWIDLRNRNIQLKLGLNSSERLWLKFNGSATMPPLKTKCPNPEGSTTQQRAAVDSDGNGGTGEVPCITPVFEGFQLHQTYDKSTTWGVGASRTLVHDTGNFVVRYKVLRQLCSVCQPTEGAPESAPIQEG
jgi:hypothetical protein